MVQGRAEGRSTKECFQLVEQVTLCKAPNVSALNMTFMSAFATHLYENQVDIFAPSSESIGIFAGLLTYILNRRTSGRPASFPTRVERVAVDYLVHAQYWILQERASVTIKQSTQRKGGLKRSHGEAIKDGEQCLTTKREFRIHHRADAAPENSNSLNDNEPLPYPDSGPALFRPDNQLGTNIVADNQQIGSTTYDIQPQNPATRCSQRF